jgi:hypothetical protein
MQLAKANTIIQAYASLNKAHGYLKRSEQASPKEAADKKAQITPQIIALLATLYRQKRPFY